MSDSTTVIRRLHQHRQWVNQNLLASAHAMTEPQLKQSFEIGQGSVWKSLLHMYAAEFVWLETLSGNETSVVPGDLPGRLPGNQQGEGPIADLAELTQRWQQLEQRWTGYLQSLTPDALDEIVYRVSTSSGFGQRFGTKVLDILLHVCTHAHYTSAQVVNMLRHNSVTPLPHTMLVTLARQETQATSL